MIWVEEAFEIRRNIRLNFGENLFFFFLLEITCFWAEKSFEFSLSAGNSASISDKPFESDSKAMRIRIKVALSCLTLSKKAPPFFQILATRLIHIALSQSAHTKKVREFKF